METKCAFTYTRQILNENKYPKPSSKTVTNGDEGEVRGENARALAKLLGSTLHLMTCWLQVFTTEMRNVPPQKGYIFFNDINKAHLF